MVRAGIYCRISRDKTGESAGVTRQMEDCRALADRNEWQIVDTYVDNDISATTGKVRPEFERMLAAVKAGELDAIVVWHTDRLYRKIKDLETLVEAIERADIILRTVQAGEFDLGTATGRMLARIMASVSAGEGELKSERWRRSIRQRREAGQPPGWGPRLFGYNRDGSVNSDEAPIVREMADWLIEGESVRAATMKLNARGILTTKGNPWSTQGLKRLITNQRLAGASTLNGEVVGVGEWDAILSPETFEQIQAVFAARRQPGRSTPRVALLLGIAYCHCDARLVSGRRADKVREYRCRKDRGGCGTIAIKAEPLEELVEAYARERLADPDVRKALDALTATGGQSIAEVIELEDRLGELEAQLETPGVPVQAIMRAIARTQERIENLRATAPATVSAPPVRAPWPVDLGRRHQLIRSAVDRVVVQPAEVVGRNQFDTDRVDITPRLT